VASARHRHRLDGVAIVLLRFDYVVGVRDLAPVRLRRHRGGRDRGWRDLYGAGMVEAPARDAGVRLPRRGVLAFINPGGTFTSLAAIFSFVLIFAGAFDIILSIESRKEIEAWWLQLIGGIVELALGFWRPATTAAAPSCSSPG
jgi:Short repeat of unknown function (DUF308)